uniref:PB1 domain-containing protein n=1 Tax=Arundo donax TaxID=35708 RepID=A0A0A9D615_ARUDO
MADGAIVVAICQYGGEFTSGPNGNLIYKGGEAHAVDVTRDMSLENFMDEVSKVFHVDVTGMSLKYFLPNNNRTLITISCDRDLQRMVDFTASAAQVDVFLISREENRSIVTQAGASIIKAGSTAGSDKRKRPTSKDKVSKNNKKTLDAPGNAVQASADNMKQPSSAVTENEDTRVFQFEFGNDVAFTTTAEGAYSTPVILDQQKLALVDSTPREVVSMFDDAANPYVHSEITEEPPQGLNNPIVLWDDIIKGVGQEFDNVKEFRAQLCKYAIGKGFVYRFIKNETTRVTVKCAAEGGCTWRLHASESSRNKKFVIKKMTDEHTCGGGSGAGQRRATRQWLTTIIKDKLNDNPLLKPKDLVKELYEEYGVTLTYSQVWRSKEVAQKEMYHAVRETYSHLPWYCERLLETNPGSISLLSPAVDMKFRRFFVAFHASFHGFVSGCRPLLFLDKVPLKATNEYKLLVAAAVDADDGVFPVAFCVVEDENYDSWVWFLMQLRIPLQTHNYPLNAMTFLSSGQKGSDAAVAQVFEDSHHAFCLHHIMEELKGELRKGPWSQQIREGMVEDFTRAAQACSIEDFNTSIESIRNISSEAADWIIASKPEHWSDAIFRGCRYDHFSSNIVDAFNNWIPTKKEGSIVLMIDSLRVKIMEVIESRLEACKAWPGSLTPTME